MGLIPGEINLLYIEDDITNAQLIMDMLRIDKHTDFKVNHKTNLMDGIKVLDSKECSYDVVLLDLVLPNSEGINTYEKVHELCEDIPIVIISTHEDIACKCVRRGAQDYILKSDVTPGLIARSLKYAIERKRLESERLLSEEKYRNLVEVARAVMYEIDFRVMKFTYVNDELCRLTGWTREELLAMSATDLLTPRSLKEFGDRLAALKNGEYISASHEFEGFLKNGDIFWTLVTAAYKEDADRNIIGANVVAIDITEKKLAQFEAEHKEEIIFNNLEIKIQEWREEITLKSVATQAKLDKISLNINSMKTAEVH